MSHYPECETCRDTCTQTSQIPGAHISAWCVWCCGRMLQTPPVNRQPLCCLKQIQNHQTENTAGYSLLYLQCVLLFHTVPGIIVDVLHWERNVFYLTCWAYLDYSTIHRNVLNSLMSCHCSNSPLSQNPTVHKKSELAAVISMSSHWSHLNVSISAFIKANFPIQFLQWAQINPPPRNIYLYFLS